MPRKVAFPLSGATLMVDKAGNARMDFQVQMPGSGLAPPAASGATAEELAVVEVAPNKEQIRTLFRIFEKLFEYAFHNRYLAQAQTAHVPEMLSRNV